MQGHPTAATRDSDDDDRLLRALQSMVDHERGAMVLPDSVFELIAAELGLSPDDWAYILDAYAGIPSREREINSRIIDINSRIMMTVMDQADRLAGAIYDHDSWQRNDALARRVAMMPQLFRIMIIDAIERFWTRDTEAGCLEDQLKSLGIYPNRTAHERLRALANRDRLEQLIARVESLSRWTERPDCRESEHEDCGGGA